MIGLVITYVLAYGGALAALVRPSVGLLAYIALAIIRPEHLWRYAVPPNNHSRMVAIACVIGWGLNGFGGWRFGAARGPVLAFCAFFGWSMVSAGQAADSAVAWEYVEELSKVFLVFLLGVTLIDSPEKLGQLAWTILLSEACFAARINEVYWQTHYNMAQEGVASQGRALIGLAMVICLPIAFFLGLRSRSRWQSCLAWCCALPIGHVVFMSFSRGAILSLIVTAAVCFWFMPKQPKHFLALALAIVVAIRFAGPQVRERFGTTFANEDERDASASGRLELWGNCIDVMGKHPLFGIGPGHFPLVASSYGWKEGKEAHSLWLQTGAEQGVPGLAFLALFYGLIVTRLMKWARAFQLKSEAWLSLYAAMTVASIAGFVVGALFVSVIRMEIPFYAALLGAGALKISSMTEFQQELASAGDCG